MTIFHIIGYWLLALTCVALLLWATWLVLGVFGKATFERMTRVYDVWTAQWVIHRVEQLGHKFPRRKIPEEYHAELTGKSASTGEAQ